MKQSSNSNSKDSMKEGSGESCSDSNQMTRHQMTIFYNGEVGAYDVTELRARAILMLASHQTEQRMYNEDGAALSSLSTTTTFRKRLCSPVNGMSMKGSLRRFLQKRKLRAQARAPY